MRAWVLALGLVTLPAQPAEIFKAYRVIGEAERVPACVLQAVCTHESGRQPYALNIAGRSHFFRTEAEARAAGEQALREGIHPDWGLCQINSYWHGHDLGDTQKALDPLYNAQLAARYLRRCYERLRNWRLAVGCYHNSYEKYAKPYRETVWGLFEAWGCEL